MQKAAERLQQFRVMHDELKELVVTLPNRRDRFLARMSLNIMKMKDDELAEGSKYSIYRS